MGFTSGIYKVKKFNNLTLNQIHTIQSYYSYQNNDWAKKNYATWEDYSQEHCKNSEGVTSADIDLYKDEYKMRDYSKSIFNCLEDWCSSGSSFHDWFISNCIKVNEYTSLLDQKLVISALKMCSDRLAEMQFKPVIVNRAFTEDDNTEIITSIPCNGVEVQDMDGNMQREYCDDFEYSNIYIPVHGYFDESEYNAFSRLQTCLINVLESTDFDNEIVFYEGGW